MQPLNYSAKCMEQFKKLAFNGPMTLLGKIVPELTEAMQVSQKFLFPDYGRVFEEGMWVDWEHTPLDLPYDVTAIEYFCPLILQEKIPEWMKIVGEETNHVPKRIALSMKRDSLERLPFLKQLVEMLMKTSNEVRGHEICPNDYFLLWPCYETNEQWIPSWCGAIVPAGLDSISSGGKMLSDQGLIEKQGYKAKEFIPVIDPSMIQELHLNRKESHSQVFQRVLFDLGDEIIATKQLCQILSCENIKTEKILASKFLNKARIKKGKQAYFDYHILIVKSDRHVAEPEEHGGTHASPRLHWRRGHIRRLPTGVRTWVRPCTVGDSDLGFLDKDYKVIKKC